MVPGFLFLGLLRGSYAGDRGVSLIYMCVMQLYTQTLALQ